MTQLARRLRMRDAVAIGVASMLGAGVFVSFGPATGAAGAGILLALLLAALIAWANADSSARLAAVLPTSGGAYAYGRARLGPLWGAVAGVAFLLGKSASAGAIATAVGTYLWPAHARAIGLLVVAALTALAASGSRRSARVTAGVVVGVLAVLMAVVVVAAAGGLDWSGLPTLEVAAADPVGVLRGAGLLFFAFAGYARIATLGEEVRDPERTLPRAIAVALGLVLVVYAVVGAMLIGVLGTQRLAGSARPVAEAAVAAGGPGWGPVVVAAACAAALVSGLAVLLGLSRTCFAMARDGLLPRTFARLGGSAAEPRPVLAQLAVGAAAALAVAVLDLAQAIALSSFAVLVYYAVANAAALTLPGWVRRVVPALGLVGCLSVAVALALG